MDLAISPGSIWKVGVRSLTNMGALTSTPTVATALAGAASVDLRASAGLVADLTIGLQTGVGATALSAIDIYDGTNSIQIAQTAAAASAITTINMVNTSSVGMRLRNTDATHSGSYLIASFTWSL